MNKTQLMTFRENWVLKNLIYDKLCDLEGLLKQYESNNSSINNNINSDIKNAESIDFLISELKNICIYISNNCFLNLEPKHKKLVLQLLEERIAIFESDKNYNIKLDERKISFFKKNEDEESLEQNLNLFLRDEYINLFIKITMSYMNNHI